VISFFARDGTKAIALQRGALLWRVVEATELREAGLFRRFLAEGLANDELALFLELRACLVTEDDATMQIPEPWERCRALRANDELALFLLPGRRGRRDADRRAA
jgi:hypothetical protein